MCLCEHYHENIHVHFEALYKPECMCWNRLGLVAKRERFEPARWGASLLFQHTQNIDTHLDVFDFKIVLPLFTVDFDLIQLLSIDNTIHLHFKFFFDFFENFFWQYHRLMILQQRFNTNRVLV